ncbi:MAG: type III-A CRISPR-associated RAMP protein Csm3 [Saprospiraceae bacterium]|nr:MAG: type III-A CRISPR-associated RAMP protein Csm3 [Saprospiraceae bacterium]
MKGKLTKKIKIEGRIVALSGLHIGGSNTGMSIGGADATVVRNPLNNEPYIPGSSLKGKMRSLLERMEGKFGGGGNTLAGPLFISDADHEVAQVFGITPEDLKKQKKEDRPIGRLIVRDGRLAGIMDGDKFLGGREGKDKLLNNKATDMPYTEVKTEVVIDRITSGATPRQLERVPAGTVFEMKLMLNVYDDEELKPLLDTVFRGLCLVHNDFLGGKGSRGSGEVKIEVRSLQYKDKTIYDNGGKWADLDKVKEKITIPDDIDPTSKATA